jgi:hypothetical protein
MEYYPNFKNKENLNFLEIIQKWLLNLQILIDFTYQDIYDSLYSQSSLFLEVNFLEIYEGIEKIRLEKVDESKTLYNSLILNILYLTVGLNLVCAIIFASSILNHYFYLENIKKFYNLVTTATIMAVEKDIEKMKVHLSLIAENKNSLTRYDFNINK